MRVIAGVRDEFFFCGVKSLIMYILSQISWSVTWGTKDLLVSRKQTNHKIISLVDCTRLIYFVFKGWPDADTIYRVTRITYS